MKIYLTESQLKKLMKRVIKETDDNDDDTKRYPEYTAQEFELMLDSHYRNIMDSIDELRELYVELESSETIDQEDKEYLLEMYKEKLIELGYSDDYEETVDFNDEENN
jgi:hypothetical protein